MTAIRENWLHRIPTLPALCFFNRLFKNMMSLNNYAITFNFQTTTAAE